MQQSYQKFSWSLKLSKREIVVHAVFYMRCMMEMVRHSSSVWQDMIGTSDNASKSMCHQNFMRNKI